MVESKALGSVDSHLAEGILGEYMILLQSRFPTGYVLIESAGKPISTASPAILLWSSTLFYL